MHCKTYIAYPGWSSQLVRKIYAGKGISLSHDVTHCVRLVHVSGPMVVMVKIDVAHDLVHMIMWCSTEVSAERDHGPPEKDQRKTWPRIYGHDRVPIQTHLQHRRHTLHRSERVM